MRWKAPKRRTAFWPTWTWSISCGGTLASTISESSSGTISMIGSPACTTPPTVWTARWNTRPSCGAHRSMRLSWSSAATGARRARRACPGSRPAPCRPRCGGPRRSAGSSARISAIRPLALRHRRRRAAPRSPCRRRGVALQRRHAAERHQVLLPQVANALQLLADPVDLLGLGGDLLLECRRSAGAAGRSARAAAPSGRRAPSGAVSNSRCSPAISRATSGSPLARDEIGREGRRLAAPSRSASKRAWRADSLVERLGDDREVGARLRAVEPDDHVALPDPVAVRTSSSPTTPPVGCWTFLTLLSTTSLPDAITAPESSVAAAQPPTPTTSNAAAMKPMASGRRAASERRRSS